jgi:putative methyltransferase (TIGR04325 family)
MLFLKIITPPIFIFWLKKLIHRKKFNRNIKNWDEALDVSTSYDTVDVVNKTLNSARLVRDGKAVYERDSVIFDKIQYDYKLLSSLLFIANTQNRLHVIDFGGALGTSYRQNLKYLDSLDVSKKWAIIEQSEYVRIGNNEFQTDILSFSGSISNINFEIDVIMMCGSICYLEKPYDILDQIKKAKPKFILIVRTPFSNSMNDELSVQIVPKNIYEATLPIWTFSKTKFITYLSDMYEVFETWDDDLQADTDTTAKGFLFQIKKS